MVVIALSDFRTLLNIESSYLPALSGPPMKAVKHWLPPGSIASAGHCIAPERPNLFEGAQFVAMLKTLQQTIILINQELKAFVEC